MLCRFSICACVHAAAAEAESSATQESMSASDDFDMDFGYEEYSEADWDEASAVRAESSQPRDAFATLSPTPPNNNTCSSTTSFSISYTTAQYSPASHIPASASITAARLDAL